MLDKKLKTNLFSKLSKMYIISKKFETKNKRLSTNKYNTNPHQATQHMSNNIYIYIYVCIYINNIYNNFVRLNLINHLVGFILCQICLYFSN